MDRTCKNCANWKPIIRELPCGTHRYESCKECSIENCKMRDKGES